MVGCWCPKRGGRRPSSAVNEGWGGGENMSVFMETRGIAIVVLCPSIRTLQQTPEPRKSPSQAPIQQGQSTLQPYWRDGNPQPSNIMHETTDLREGSRRCVILIEPERFSVPAVAGDPLCFSTGLFRLASQGRFVDLGSPTANHPVGGNGRVWHVPRASQ